MSQIDGSNRVDFIRVSFISRNPVKSSVWRRHVGIDRADSYDSLDDSVLETIYLKLFDKNVQRDELLQEIAQNLSFAFFLPSLMSIFRVFGSILVFSDFICEDLGKLNFGKGRGAEAIVVVAKEALSIKSIDEVLKCREVLIRETDFEYIIFALVLEILGFRTTQSLVNF